MGTDAEAQKTLEDLRQLVQLAVSDLEAGMGGSMPREAQHALRHWLARAFELGAAFGAARVKSGGDGR